MKSFSGSSFRNSYAEVDSCSSESAPMHRLYRARHIDGGERSISLYEELGEPDIDAHEHYGQQVLRWKVPWSIVVVLVIVLAVLGAWVFFSSSSDEVLFPEKEVSSHPTDFSVEELSESSPSALSVSSVWVHVVGAVKSPGLYELPDQSRVADAISAAQGLVEDANSDSINLASKVSDGQQIRVLFQGQSSDMFSETSTSHRQVDGISSSLVNINTASAEELETLPRVGPATAQKIIEFRQAHGGFRDVTELESVSGIGPALLERLRPLVRV